MLLLLLMLVLVIPIITTISKVLRRVWHAGPLEPHQLSRSLPDLLVSKGLHISDIFEYFEYLHLLLSPVHKTKMILSAFLWSIAICIYFMCLFPPSRQGWNNVIYFCPVNAKTKAVHKFQFAKCTTDLSTTEDMVKLLWIWDIAIFFLRILEIFYRFWSIHISSIFRCLTVAARWEWWWKPTTAPAL